MKTHSLRVTVALTSAFVPGVAMAQHEAHHAGAPQASTGTAQCARVQPVVDNIFSSEQTLKEFSENPAKFARKRKD